MITQEYIKQLFTYADGNLYWKISRSNSIKVGQKVGTTPKHNYAQTYLDGKNYRVHRLIFLYHHGYFPAEIDHIDGNPRNNCVENLRAATRVQNQQNAKLRKDNISGIAGVYWYKSTSRWKVQINIDKVKTHLGYFKDKELAELVAIEARDKYHKEFARHK